MFQNRKVLFRIMVCVFLFTTVQSIGFVKETERKDGGHFGAFLRNFMVALEHNYTVEELLDMTLQLKDTLAETPAMVSTAVNNASLVGQYGQPMDDTKEGSLKQVYAVAGGRVLRVGVQNDIGLYVIIEHTDTISTYGHLIDVTVLSGDRIKKGDIIGSFDSKSGVEFYYEMTDKTSNIP